MINTGPWGMRWEWWLCKVKKSILSLISSIHHQFSNHNDNGEDHIIATKSNFKLHPLPCSSLLNWNWFPWRNYSSASIIYCHDKRVGTFLFGGISGKALCRREKTESSANERNMWGLRGDESVSELGRELWRTMRYCDLTSHNLLS